MLLWVLDPGWLQGEHKKEPLCLLLIFQQWMQIFAWNFVHLLDKKIYTFNTEFYWLYLTVTKLCCFIQDNPLFLSVPTFVFSSNLLVALKRTGLLMMRWGCRTEDGQSYCSFSMWSRQSLGEGHHCFAPVPDMTCNVFGVMLNLAQSNPLLCWCVLAATLPSWSAGDFQPGMRSPYFFVRLRFRAYNI